jgi:hypothetical protein
MTSGDKGPRHKMGVRKTHKGRTKSGPNWGEKGMREPQRFPTVSNWRAKIIVVPGGVAQYRINNSVAQYPNADHNFRTRGSVE